MGRHSAPSPTRTPMTPAQAFGMLVNDLSDAIDKGDGYDGHIPADALSPDVLERLLPDLLRAAGIDLFATSPAPVTAPVAAPDGEWEWVPHTCNPRNPGKPLPYGRKAPEGQCRSCDQLRAGRPARDAHPAIQATNRKRDNEERSRRELEDHYARKHADGRCADGPVCTFGQW